MACQSRFYFFDHSKCHFRRQHKVEETRIAKVLFTEESMVRYHKPKKKRLFTAGIKADRVYDHETQTQRFF